MRISERISDEPDLFCCFRNIVFYTVKTNLITQSRNGIHAAVRLTHQGSLDIVRLAYDACGDLSNLLIPWGVVYLVLQIYTSPHRGSWLHSKGRSPSNKYQVIGYPEGYRAIPEASVRD